KEIELDIEPDYKVRLYLTTLYTSSTPEHYYLSLSHNTNHSLDHHWSPHDSKPVQTHPNAPVTPS
ncbi:MAG: hypothetical protein M1830_009025, partial [Pleopsidium flavum]